jgi:S1-C subfamily serine protease
MNNRVLKALAVLAGFSLVLFVGAIVGGGIVYALTQLGDVLPEVQAQEADPGYGIVIASVEPDDPATEAGVVRGDILLEMDGEALEDVGDLMRHLDELEPGDEVELTVLHGDDLRTLTATLGDRDGGAYLGVFPCGGLHKEIDVDVDVRVGGPGVVIVEVMADSPAEEAGLQEDDVIMAVDGQELDAENTLADLIAAYEPGDTVTLKIERPDDEEPFEVTVQLGEHPDKEDTAYLGVRYGSLPRIDVFRSRSLPFDELEEFEFDELPFAFPEGDVKQGAVVQRVFEDGPASAAGLEEGDVITVIDGQPVEDPQALADAITEREPGDTITLTVYQRDSEEEREIDIALAEHPDEEGRAYLGVLIGGFFRLERHRFEGDERPYDFDFDFDFELPLDELPFDLDDLPHRFRFGLPLEEWDSDLEELPERFEFRWPPGEDLKEEPGLGDSI